MKDNTDKIIAMIYMIGLIIALVASIYRNGILEDRLSIIEIKPTFTIKLFIDNIPIEELNPDSIKIPHITLVIERDK